MMADHPENDLVSSRRWLQRRLDFERRLTTVSAALMRSDDAGLDEAVVAALAAIGDFFQVDRAYLFEIDEQAGHQSNTYEWVAEGISAEAHNLQQVPLQAFPWLLGELRADRAVALEDVQAVPEDAGNERREFERQAIRSIAIVPIWDGARLTGFAGFDAVRRPVAWDEDYMIGLRLLAQMLGSALRGRATARRLRSLAFHDPLTGLPNRALLSDRLEAALRRARRYATGLLVVMLDLDDFKPVNDAHGHAVGDAALCEVARRLQRSLRTTDTVARLGGDEFVLVIEDAGESVDTVANRLLAAFDAVFEVEGLQLRLSPSIGVAIAGPDDDCADKVLRRADAAMYQAKSAGKHRWVSQPG
jgi:diguanylate cyclase (GGDEF)-like protein